MQVRNQTASLTFRGFEVPPETVQSWVGIPATCKGTKGQPVKSGVRTILVRSYISFAVEQGPSESVFQLMPALFRYVGGLDHIAGVQDRLGAEFVGVNLVLPFKHSDEQTNGWIDTGAIAALHRLGATLSFEIL